MEEFITIPLWEYKDLIKKELVTEIISSMAQKNNYIAREDIFMILAAMDKEVFKC